MKVTEVYFKRNYAISPLTMEHMHLSATVVVEENDNPEEALKLAQKTVEDFYKEACSNSISSEYPNFNEADSWQSKIPSIDYKKQEKLDGVIDSLNISPTYKIAMGILNKTEFKDSKELQELINMRFKLQPTNNS